ncbi:MAG: hypothetical protein V4584_08220, partial [Verrucomicrobiota bacterium]
MNENDPKSPGAGNAGIPFADLVRDKLVLVAMADGAVTADFVRANGARDVLILDREGPERPTREGNHVRQRCTRLSDVRTNNCNVAILHGKSAFALIEKRKFARFSHILVPTGLAQAAVALGLSRYGRRKTLVKAGNTEIVCNGRRVRYVVLKADVKLRDHRRQYGPAGLTPLELMQRLSGLEYAALRWSELMESGEHEGDIDLLVSQEALKGLLERYGREISTYPLDVYTDDGQGGYGYKSVPYFTPALAKGVLTSATVTSGGIRVAAPEWRFLAFCYHLMFHNKSEKVAPGTVDIRSETFHSPHYYQELVRLAGLAGKPVPRTFDDIEELLKNAGALPSLDLIGFYSNKNAFLKKRYFDRAPLKAGLATFFIRDFGNTREMIPELKQRLTQHFEILSEGPVDDSNRESIILGVRGGNWADNDAPGGRAEPVYWFVCWDPAPRAPSARTRRKHPRVDNEHIRLKDDLRR